MTERYEAVNGWVALRGEPLYRTLLPENAQYAANVLNSLLDRAERVGADLAAEKAAHIQTLAREAEAARNANRMRDDIEAERDALQARLTAVEAVCVGQEQWCSDERIDPPRWIATVRAAASGQEG